MKLKDVLEKVNKDTFKIYDYTKLEDPVSFHMKNNIKNGMHFNGSP